MKLHLYDDRKTLILLVSFSRTLKCFHLFVHVQDPLTVDVAALCPVVGVEVPPEEVKLKLFCLKFCRFNFLKNDFVHFFYHYCY